jgi:Fur family transcriptional regulator, ferric uptake regulator
MSASSIHDHSHDAWKDHARATLRDEGFRTGGARSAVIDLLARQQCCRSAQEIWEELHGEDAAPGIASVYRAVETLQKLGLVQRVDVGEGVARYEPALPGGDHHHHVVCERCGRIVPFSDDRLERAIDSLGERLGHRVSGHEVVIRGACRPCESSSGGRRPRRR